jgi:hypothetical protein
MALDDFLNERSSLKGFKEEKDPDIIGLDLEIMKQEHKDGVKIADYCEVEHMRENFAWMKGHQNCWTGFPNDGKTQFTLFMMMIKSLKSNWKWVVWSPEMKGANYVDGKIKVHYNTLAYDMMASITGKTPYRHISEKYKVPLVSIDELSEQKKWIEDHFIFLNPQKKDIKSIYETLKRIWNNQGYDGILIDPFKNIEAEHNVRDDKHLHDVFSKFKDFSVETNTVMNWIAHPKSGVSRVVQKKGEEVLVPCNQYMLAGGAAWDNSMDGIYSIQRPNCLTDIRDPSVAFHNLKQRMQELVANRGVVSDIEFDIKTRRYIFGGKSPLGFAETSQEKSNNYESGSVFQDSNFDKPEPLPF